MSAKSRYVSNFVAMSAKRLLEILECFNLSVGNSTMPTHKSNHVLDLVVTRSNEDLIDNIHVHDPVISDPLQSIVICLSVNHCYPQNV